VKGRHPTRTSGLTSELHPICARHRSALRSVPRLVAAARASGGRIYDGVFSFDESHDFRNLARDLRAGGFDPDYSARQIVDDVYRLLGVGWPHVEQHLVEALVKAALVF